MDYKNEKPNDLKSLKDMKSEQTGFLFVLNLILSLKSPVLYLSRSLRPKSCVHLDSYVL